MFGTILAGKDAILVDFFLPQDVRVRLLSRIGIDYILSSTNQYILSDQYASIILNAEKDDVNGMEYDENIQEGNILTITATAEESDKAVVLNPSGFMSAIRAMGIYCHCTEEDRVLSQVPLQNIFGLVYSLLWPLSHGACVCIGRGLRHIDSDTYYYHPTILPGTPSMIEYLKKIKAFNEELDTIVIGGAPCSYRLFECLKNRDFNVYAIYGMTEATGCIGINKEPDGSYELYDEVHVEVAKDGELLVSGPRVMVGYDHDDKANAKALKDGVLHTGEYGYLNEYNRLVVEKRNPGILLLPTGEKICRREVEREMMMLKGVKESWLTLYEDKLTTVIVPVDHDTGYDKIKRHIDQYNKNKGYRWEVQKIVLYDKLLPRTEDGKIDEAFMQNILKNA
jgi:long-subunit acyl-CoA synthetase (AMP-forming)